MTKKEKKRRGLGCSTYIGAGKVSNTKVSTRDVIIIGACANSTVTKSDVVELYLHTTAGSNVRITASVLNEICCPISQQPIRTTINNYPHLQGLKFADYHYDNNDLKIDILLGAEFYYQLVTDNVRRGPSGTPVAVDSKFGWLLAGPAMYGENTHANISSIYTLKCSECDVLDTNEPERLSEAVSKFWDLECVGIKNVEKSVVDSFLDTIKYDDVENAYEVSLPWKPNHPRLPDNYSNATKRLGSTFNRLKRNPEVLKEYHEIISDQLQKNVIEKCDKTNANEQLHYLPHREDKQTTKMRIVYDCSSKLSNDVSPLNECLYKGPSLNQMIFDVLLRFRLHQTAFICDLKKAFLQIRVMPKIRKRLFTDSLGFYSA